jgi:L-threonylcarbamoyladenylate synthase
MKKQEDVLFLGSENGEDVARRVSAVLGRGGVCVIPTDTIYGIVAIDNFRDAVKRIYAIKGRPRNKPFIRLVGSLDSLRAYTGQPLPESLEKYWPGPLTIIFRGFHGEKVSIRYPSSPFLHEIFRRINYDVLVAPSANLSGEDNIFASGPLIEAFSGKVDFIVCRKKELKEKKPSTIIDISEREWRVVREGALRLDFTGPGGRS